MDKIVKQALKYTNIDIHIPLSKSEIKGLIKVAVRKMWQERWDKGIKGWHLYNIYKQVGHVRTAYGNRKDNTISRLRIGRSNLNKSLQVIGKHESGQCNHCGLPETVEHVLINSRAYERERESSSCGSVVEHCVSSAKGCGFNSLGTHIGYR